MDERPQWKLGYRPQLDGVRGLAIIFVLVQHAEIGVLRAAGSVGVSMFFALSGFLITYLLLQEKQQRGRIVLGAFYRRRALRLLPALFVFVVAMSALSLVENAPGAPGLEDVLGTLFYVSNYTTALQGHDNVLVHTWSLAVEEQFYIVWPLVVIVLMGSRTGVKRLVVAAGTLVVLAGVLRTVLWDGGAGMVRVYVGTDTNMDSLLVGCLTAIYVGYRSPVRARRSAVVTILVLLVAISIPTGFIEMVVVPLVVPLLTAALIVAVLATPTAAVVRAPWLQLVGRRSYAIYLWHFPLFAAASEFARPVQWLALLVAIALTAAITELSWRCVEEPFLSLKSRLAAEPGNPLTEEAPVAGR